MLLYLKILKINNLLDTFCEKKTHLKSMFLHWYIGKLDIMKTLHLKEKTIEFTTAGLDVSKLQPALRRMHQTLWTI